MKTAEEILDKHYSGLSTGDVIRAMEEYADKVKPKWISIDDDIPEEKTDVLIVNKHAHLKTPKMIAFMFDKQFYSVLFPGQALTVTHWMPLPE